MIHEVIVSYKYQLQFYWNFHENISSYDKKYDSVGTYCLEIDYEAYQHAATGEC